MQHATNMHDNVPRAGTDAQKTTLSVYIMVLYVDSTLRSSAKLAIGLVSSVSFGHLAVELARS